MGRLHECAVVEPNLAQWLKAEERIQAGEKRQPIALKEWPARMEPMSSPSPYAGFERLRAQRGDFFPMIEGMGMETLWHRPSNADRAVGDTILHLCNSRLPSLHELQDQLELETCRMKNMLARLTEGGAGHFRIFDPGVGSPNLIQRVQLLAFHERHHFKAMGHLIADQGLGFQKKVVRRNGPQASLD